MNARLRRATSLNIIFYQPLVGFTRITVLVSFGKLWAVTFWATEIVTGSAYTHPGQADGSSMIREELVEPAPL